MFQVSSVGLGLVLLTLCPVSQSRVFKSADGQTAIAGKATSYDQTTGKVQIKTSSVETTSVDFSWLCKADQEFLRKKFRVHVPVMPLDESMDKLVGHDTRVVPLDESMDKLVGQLAANTAPGHIVRVSGGDVYVDLGTNRGVVEGLPLRIVRGLTADNDAGLPQNVLGTLRVTSAKEKFSICQVVDGRAQQRDSPGNLNNVLPVFEDLAVTVGKVSVPAKSKVNGEQIEDALRTAIQRSKLFKHAVASADNPFGANAKSAPHEFRVEVVPGPVSIDLKLRLIARVSGQPIGTASCTHKLGITLAELGYKSALTAVLDAESDFKPPKNVIEKRFTNVKWNGDACVFARLGVKHEDAWILPEGRIIVASNRSLSDRGQVTRLEVALREVASKAGILGERIDAALLGEIDVYSEKRNQFQSLGIGKKSVPKKANSGTTANAFGEDEYDYGFGFPGAGSRANADGDYTLSWPNAKARWATVTFEEIPSAVPCYDVKLNGNWIVEPPDRKNFGGFEAPSIYGTQTKESFLENWYEELDFGQKALSCRYVVWAELRVYFEEPAGCIAIYDKTARPVTSRAIFSQPLSNIAVPVIPEP